MFMALTMIAIHTLFKKIMYFYSCSRVIINSLGISDT